ncbi:MAG: tripartite tricarboxylate transporter substrate binding protein [Bacillota bacterium]|nr:tripartite tricarboxylate transporter substrate binding protein [Bacillota bacterium]
MKRAFRIPVAVVVLAVVVLSVTGVGLAKDDYPAKPVRMIVAFSPGGATDIIARIVSQKLSERLGQPVVVENKPGATGIIGTEMVAKSPADGYTLLMVTAGTHAINASLYSKLPYDPVKDFTHVVWVANAPNVLVVNASNPINSVKELIEAAKKKPGQLTFGSAGSGSTLHLAGELFKSMAGVDIVHVPYKGGAPAMTDLLGGQIAMMFDSISQAVPHINAGKLKALGVTSATRSLALPNIPTIAEAGVPGYEAMAWFGVVAPAKLPKPILDKLNKEINVVLQLPEVVDRLRELGTEPVGGSPAKFTAHVEAEVAKWAKVVKESGAQVN